MSKNKVLVQLHGPASSGKTTLARGLHNKLGGEFVDEVIRKVNVDLKKMCDPHYAAKKEQELLELHYATVVDALKHNDIVIADRSIYCYGVYTKFYMMNGNLGINDFLAYDKKIGHFIDVMENYLDIISDVYTISLDSVGFVDDGYRMSPNYELEKSLFNLDRNQRKERMLYIPSKSKEKRLETALNYINYGKCQVNSL